MDFQKMLEDQSTSVIQIETFDFALERIKEAASISGLDVESFVLAVAFSKAEEVLQKYSAIELSGDAFDRLQQIIKDSEDSPKPSPKLIDLFKNRRKKKD